VTLLHTKIVYPPIQVLTGPSVDKLMLIEANTPTTTPRHHSAMATNPFLSCLYVQLAPEAKIIV